MAIDSSIDTKYDVLRLGVISSNSITSRTAVLLKHLNQAPLDAKTPIASLRAQAAVASKLISAVEIAKRDLYARGLKTYQYSDLSFETVKCNSVRKRGAGNTKPGNDGTFVEEKEDEEDGTFEVMGKDRESEDMPVLTVYLSLVPVKELRDAYG